MSYWAAALLIAAPAIAGTVGTTAAVPTSVPVGISTTVTFTSVISDPSVIAAGVQLQSLDSGGRVLSVVGTLHDDGLNGDAAAGDGTFSIQTTVYQKSPGTLTFRVAAAFKGSLTRAFSAPVAITITGASIGLNILTPQNLLYTGLTPVNVAGSTGDPAATVKVNGINAPVTNGQFLATVPLVEGLNTLTAVATNSGGAVTTATVQVTLDTTPPHLTIDSPLDGSTTTASTITVTGTANDVVVGTVNGSDVQVIVNGIGAQVANRTYLAANIPLLIGANKIQAVGTDRAGNSTTVSATVTRVSASKPSTPGIGVPVITDSLNLVSGNNQTGTVGLALGSPLVVSLTDSNNHPVSNQPVVFSVSGNNGTLSTGAPAAPSVTVNTDSNGKAQVLWTLGQRSGAGINTVQVSSALTAATATFSATGLPGGGAQIVVDSGNNQTGAIGQALSFPFVAVVTDSGHNRIPNIAVTFTVKQGGGTLDGAFSQTLTTDSNGRAIAVLTLGSQPGNSNNVVQADFPGDLALPAVFAASALAPGDPSATTISGIVLDNSNNPLQGVTMRLYQTNQGSNNNLPLQIGTPVQTNAAGAFLISPAPVGYFKLMADGSTAVGNNAYPTMEYDIVTVAGQNNTVGTPIYLTLLDTVNQLCVTPTVGGTLTLPQTPGFSLTVAPGSATFPGGARTGCVSVSVVNPDKIPMAPGFGQQPKFIVTIQPVGTLFNPPAPITIPNLEGLAPKAVTEMYSYDHDLSMFVAIGTGTVSADGSVIASNPGVGVLKAGWHCGGDPDSTGTCGTCAQCQTASGDGCVADPSQDGDPIDGNQCTVCTNGASAPIPLDPTKVTKQLTFGLPTPVLTEVTDAINSFGHVLGIDLTTNLLQIQGIVSTQQCCDPAEGKGSNTDGNVTGNFGGFTLKGKIWPPGPIPDVDESTSIGGVTLGFKAKFLGGLFVNLGAQVNGNIGFRQSDCSDVPADKDGCFYANLNTTFTPGFDVEITGSAEIDIGSTMFMGSVGAVLGDFNWPINLSAVGYNTDNCAQGLNGGLFTAPKGSLSISANFSIGIVVAGASLTYQKTWTFLSCDLFATSLPSCTVNIF